MADPRESDEEKGGLPRDLTKRILTLGLGAYFLTEDTVPATSKTPSCPVTSPSPLPRTPSKAKTSSMGSWPES